MVLFQKLLKAVEGLPLTSKRPCLNGQVKCYRECCTFYFISFMELSSAFSTHAGKLSHAVPPPHLFFFFFPFFLIFCLPALKKGWYHLVIFQCCSLVVIATCSHEAKQRALPSSGNFQDCHAVGRSRRPNCTARKVWSWHSTLTTPPSLHWNFLSLVKLEGSLAPGKELTCS